MKILLLFTSAALLFGCSSSTEETTRNAPEPYVQGMDTTARPQSDFYQYANGGWLKSTAIPAHQPSWSVFDELQEKTERECLSLLLDASQSQAYPEGSDVRKAIRFYRRAMDSLLAERRGLSPLQSTLSKIALIKTKADLQRYLMEAHSTGNNVFFEISVRPDLVDNKTHGVFISAIEPWLPDKDFYLSFDAKAKEVRARYELHISTMLQLAATPEVQAKKEAATIVAYETSLAKFFPTPEERNDPSNWNNPRSISDLNRMMPSIQWEDFFKGLSLTADTVNVDEPLFAREWERSFSTFSIETIKSYLRWSVLRNAAPYLHHAMVRESFEFNQKYLRGVERLTPRWQRAFRETNQHFGDAIAKLYIRKSGNAETMAAVREIINNVRFGMADRIKTRTWLTDSTKELALTKLQRMQLKIGYPEKWHGYAALSINTDTTQSSFFEDVVSARRHHRNESLQKAGKPVDAQEWNTTPQAVNIFYDRSANQLVVPLSLLQPPFFDAQQDDAFNYGAIGALVGHEVIHAFDMLGTHRDATGNLHNWLTNEERKKFGELIQQLILQQSKNDVIPSVPLKATRTVNEDLADLGGLAIALEGLQRARREKLLVEKSSVLAPEQRFFLSWASLWRIKYRPEQLTMVLKEGTHSPAMVRAVLPLIHLQAFDSAFQVKEGDLLYKAPKDRLEIW